MGQGCGVLRAPSGEEGGGVFALMWPMLAYTVVVFALVAVIMVFTHLVGERHRERATGQPYESGVSPTGSARLRFPSSFYLIAMVFVIFDLEAAFIFAWAVAARELGWAGYLALLVFVGVLLLALLYLWRSGALEWRTRRQRSGGFG
jgi:NADH-quinone oxidoreductase subunit A